MGPGVLGDPQKLCPLLGRPGPCTPSPPPGCPRAAGGCRELLWGVRGWTLPCWEHSQGDSPQKEEPTARQGAASLRDTAGPSMGVPPGRGSHQASHYTILSCSPQLLVQDPSAIPRLPAAALRSQSEFLGWLQR